MNFLFYIPLAIIFLYLCNKFIWFVTTHVVDEPLKVNTSYIEFDSSGESFAYLPTQVGKCTIWFRPYKYQRWMHYDAEGCPLYHIEYRYL